MQVLRNVSWCMAMGGVCDPALRSVTGSWGVDISVTYYH